MRFATLALIIALAQQPTPSQVQDSLRSLVETIHQLIESLNPPAPTSVVVGNAAELQAALNRAATEAGITIELAPGDYVGNFRMRRPAQTSDGRVTTIRTQGWEAPVGRPANAQGMAVIRAGNATPALSADDGGGYIRFTGVAFGASPDGSGDIVVLDGSRYVEFDQVYMAGSDKGQKRGIAANGANTIVRRSRMENFWRDGQDSQAIAMFTCTKDVLIEDNYLEAGSENILIGGAQPSSEDCLPQRIAIQGNHFTKRLSWKGDGTKEVRNLFEIKYAKDVTITGNTFENNWKDGQTGYGILFTVATGLTYPAGCPVCRMENVVFANNVIRNVGAGMQILGSSYKSVSGRLDGLIIRNNLWEIDGPANGGNGWFVIIQGGPLNVTIENNTVRQSGTSFVYAVAGGIWPEGSTTVLTAPPPQNLIIRHNAFNHGTYGIFTPTGTKGVGNGWFGSTFVMEDNAIVVPATTTGLRYTPSNLRFPDWASVPAGYGASLP
jgi:hypothetical protein